MGRGLGGLGFGTGLDNKKRRGIWTLGLLFKCYSISHLTTGTVVPSEVPPAGTFVCREVLGVFLGKEINVFLIVISTCHIISFLTLVLALVSFGLPKLHFPGFGFPFLLSCKK